jgi:hypothetical protein
MIFSAACDIATRQLVWVWGDLIGSAAQIAAMGRKGQL